MNFIYGITSSSYFTLHTNISWISLVSALAILSILLFAYILSQKKKHVLLKKETHHRLKNNMQMFSSILNLQERCIEEDNSAVELHETKNRFGALSQLNKCLLQGKTGIAKKVNATSFVNTLVSHFQNQFEIKKMPNINVNVDTKIENLDANKVIPVGLIINEIILCIEKHNLYSREVTIHLDLDVSEEGSVLSLINPYESEDWQKVTNRAISRNIIFKLAEQLKTKPEIDISQGLRFTMAF